MLSRMMVMAGVILGGSVGDVTRVAAGPTDAVLDCFDCIPTPIGEEDAHTDVGKIRGMFQGGNHGFIAGSCADWDFDHVTYGGGGGGSDADAALADGSDEAILTLVLEADRAYLNVEREAVQFIHESGQVTYHTSLRAGQARRLEEALSSFRAEKLVGAMQAP